MTKIMEVTLSAENRIVLPQEACDALRVRPGDKLVLVVRDDRMIVLAKARTGHSAIRGLGRGLYSKTYLHDERQSWD